MNAYAVVLKPARLTLILFAVSVFCTLAAILGQAEYRREKQLTLAKTEKMLANTRDEVGKLSYDLDTIKRCAEKYKRLNRLGFIGEPDRDGWVQRLESIYRDTHLPPVLRYTLAPPQPVNPRAEEDATSYHVLQHDLNIELSGIHEGEFLDFLGSLAANWQTPYRVENCRIARNDANEAITGLQISCTLRLFSLTVEGRQTP